MRIVNRFFSPPSSSYFLFGPRGTGKTTWLQEHYQDSLYIDLLQPDIFRRYNTTPEYLRNIIEGNPEKRIIIIDEIQRAPELLPLIHSLIEERKNISFILTGSSARKLKRSGTDLLAGRSLLKTFHPFIANEIPDTFNLTKACHIGMLPLVVAGENPEKVLNTYAALYLREEVQMEGFVRNIGNFSRFMEAVSFSQASQLNVSEIARECQVERKTVEGYITILEDLLLCHLLPVFSKKAKRKLVTHRKFYYFDAGVFYSLRPKGPLDRPEETAGACLESLVFQHLKAYFSYREQETGLYFWRTRAGNEVDFICYGKDVFTAIEVKNSKILHPKDFSGLKAFREDYPEAQLLLLYRGKDKIRKHSILCLPCESFLLHLNPKYSLREIMA